MIRPLRLLSALDAWGWYFIRPRPRPGVRPRIVFHIGPHKTGTTSIQALLRTNRRRLRPSCHILLAKDPPLRGFLNKTNRASRKGNTKGLASGLKSSAEAIAAEALTHPLTLVSSEDLMGRLPTRFGRVGLYPLAAPLLSSLSSACRNLGVDATFVIYQRDMDSWTESLIRQLNDPEVDAAPQAFRIAHGLEETWEGLTHRVREAVAPAPLLVISFEEEVQSKRLGTALVQNAGVPQRVIAHLKWPRPRNVRSSQSAIPD